MNRTDALRLAVHAMRSMRKLVVINVINRRTAALVVADLSDAIALLEQELQLDADLERAHRAASGITPEHPSNET